MGTVLEQEDGLQAKCTLAELAKESRTARVSRARSQVCGKCRAGDRGWNGMGSGRALVKLPGLESERCCEVRPEVRWQSRVWEARTGVAGGCGVALGCISRNISTEIAGDVAGSRLRPGA